MKIVRTVLIIAFAFAVCRVQGATAPASIAGVEISSTTTSATGAFSGSEGQTVTFAYNSDGTGAKTKDGQQSPITYANYSANGDTTTFDLTDSGMTGQVTLTFTSTTAGTFSVSFGSGNTQSGTFTVVGSLPPTLVSSSLVDGVVTFVFSEPMDTNWRSFSWNAGQFLPNDTFTNFRWNQDATAISFDAALSEGTSITFILNPTGFSGDFRNAGGRLLAPDTSTQVLTVRSLTNRILSLDGDGDYVTIPSSSAIQPPNEFTIEAWLFPRDNVKVGNHNPHFLSKSDGQSGNSSRTYEVGYSDGILRFTVFLGTDTFAVTGASVPSNQWVHFAGVFDSSAGFILILTNSVEAASTMNAGSNPIQGLQTRQTTRALTIGRLNSDSTFGRLEVDELRIWNVARSPEQIRSSMRSRLTGQEANLVAYWNFDDGKITDLTGNGLNGTRVDNASIGLIAGNDIPHAPYLVSVVPQGSSIVDLMFESETNRTQRIEYSGNLTNWTTLMALTSTNSPMTVTDSNAQTTNRFYRVITP